MSIAIPQRPRLAIVGASVRAAAQSAIRVGFAVQAFDLFADSDLAAICPVTKLSVIDASVSELIRSAAVDAWIYTGAIENYPELVRATSVHTRLLGCDAAVLAKVRDPQWLASTLAAAGYAFPAIAQSVSSNEASRWLIKQRRSGGGMGISRCNDNDDPPLDAAEQYYQQLIAGKPCSAMFVASSGDCHLLASFEQFIGQAWTGAPAEFMYCGAMGPLMMNSGAREQLRGIGELIAKAASIQGIFGIDFMLSGRQVTVLEVNPRYTASMELWERATGRSAIDLHWRACCELPFDVEHWERGECHAKAIVYARDSISVDVPIEHRIADDHRTEWPVIADVPVCRQKIGVGEPICTLFSQGADATSTELALKALAERVHSLW